MIVYISRRSTPTCCIVFELVSPRFPAPPPCPDIMAAPVFFNRSPIFAERPETAFLVVFSQTYYVKMATGRKRKSRVVTDG